MSRNLSRTLHKLTLRLDRAADRILREEAALSYARFLALYMVGREGAATQRELAERLGVSEASVSRMVRVLGERGWLQSSHTRGGGNRRSLTLTRDGEALLVRWGSQLEDRLASVMATAEVPYANYRAQTEQLLAALESATAEVPDSSASHTRRMPREAARA